MSALALLLTTGSLTAFAALPDEALVELYHASDVAALEAALASTPDSTASGQFLRGLFEADGAVSKTCFSRALELNPSPALEILLRDRLDQHRRAAQAASDANTMASPLLSEPGSLWTVQTGAFSSRSGAESFARRIARFGKVEYVTKKYPDGRDLIAVTVGRFTDRSKAEALAMQIHAGTGVKGMVLKEVRN
ncbi:MAG: SPOR domain-containing protein [Calditrichaeota bacterium]|nr:SPOR domain-containing protein [Calditrichota bacterium]